MSKPCLNQFEWNQIHIIFCSCNHLPNVFYLRIQLLPILLIHNYLHSISSAAVHSQWSRSCTVIPHKKPVPPHIEETGCNLVHRKTPRLISLSIAWYPCIQNPRPRHSQVNWRLSIRQFSWLQFIVSLRLPKKISQWPRTLCVLLQSSSLLQWRDRFGLTKFSIKSKDT